MHVYGNMCVMLLRNLEKQCMYMEDIFLKTPLLIYFFQNFFPIFKLPNSGCSLSVSVSRATALDEEYIFSSTVF